MKECAGVTITGRAIPYLISTRHPNSIYSTPPSLLRVCSCYGVYQHRFKQWQVMHIFTYAAHPEMDIAYSIWLSKRHSFRPTRPVLECNLFLRAAEHCVGKKIRNKLPFRGGGAIGGRRWEFDLAAMLTWSTGPVILYLSSKGETRGVIRSSLQFAIMLFATRPLLAHSSRPSVAVPSLSTHSALYHVELMLSIDLATSTTSNEFRLHWLCRYSRLWMTKANNIQHKSKVGALFTLEPFPMMTNCSVDISFNARYVYIHISSGTCFQEHVGSQRVFFFYLFPLSLLYNSRCTENFLL